MRTLVLLFFLISVTSAYSEKVKDVSSDTMIAGDLSPAEVVELLFADRIHTEEGVLKVEVSVPIIKDSKVLIEDVEGLPIHNDAGRIAEQSVMMIPFSIESDTEKKNLNDFYQFIDGMDVMLSRLKIDDLQIGEKGVVDEPNCGGYAVGSKISSTWTSDWPLCRSIATTYTCLHVNGLNNWYITNQVETSWPCNIEP